MQILNSFDDPICKKLKILLSTKERIESSDSLITDDTVVDVNKAVIHCLLMILLYHRSYSESLSIIVFTNELIACSYVYLTIIRIT
jgi:hypothetical protein